MANPSDIITQTVLVLRDLVKFIVLAVFYYCEAIFKAVIKPSPKSLAGEVILITGAANGIGRECCLLLADSKAKLVCWDIDENANKNLVSQLRDLGCDAYNFKVDISDRSQVQTVADKVKRTVGDVTILVNNAGIMPCKQFLLQSPQELENTFKVNVFGQFWTLKEFLPTMISKNKGHIVTLCSAAGLVPIRNLAPYCGTKFAIHGFIESLKDDLRNMPKRPNINFTTVYPYSCNTGLLSGIKSYSRFPWLQSPVLQPEEVALKLVDGMRRNYEHVYVPEFIRVAAIFVNIFIPKVKNAAMDFVQCYVEPS